MPFVFQLFQREREQLFAAAADFRRICREHQIPAGGTAVEFQFFHISVAPVVFLQLSLQQGLQIDLQRTGQQREQRDIRRTAARFP